MLAAAGPALWPIAIPAIAGVIGVAIGAGGTVLATSRANDNARLLAREAHEREMAQRRQQRIDERRADVYCLLLVSVNRQVEAMRRTLPLMTFAGEDLEPPPQPEPEDEFALEAQVAAFGSPAVDELRAEWRAAWAKFLGLAHSVRFLEQHNQAPPRQELEEQRAAAMAIVQRLEARIRHELQEAPGGHR